jgi:hypothetical protein
MLIFSIAILTNNLNEDQQPLDDKGNDHEVKFHEIKIQLFQEVKFLIMRSKFNLFMRSNLSNNIDQEVNTSIMRSKPKIELLAILIS